MVIKTRSILYTILNRKCLVLKNGRTEELGKISRPAPSMTTVTAAAVFPWITAIYRPTTNIQVAACSCIDERKTLLADDSRAAEAPRHRQPDTHRNRTNA